MPFHLAGELQPLCFAAGETGRFFSEGQVSQAQILENLEPLADSLEMPAGFQRCADVHCHQLRQGPGSTFLILFIHIFYSLCVFGIAGTAAFRAGDLHIGQKLNVQADHAGAIADRAAQFPCIVGKVSGLESEFFCVPGSGKCFPQFIVYIGVGGDGRAGR